MQEHACLGYANGVDGQGGKGRAGAHSARQSGTEKEIIEGEIQKYHGTKNAICPNSEIACPINLWKKATSLRMLY